VAVRKQKQKQRRMSAQVVEDEDYQLRYEIVAGTGVAKESAAVCVRMPPAEGRKYRRSQVRAVPATVPAITELAAELQAARGADGAGGGHLRLLARLGAT
jgi:hypothetical protein